MIHFSNPRIRRRLVGDVAAFFVLVLVALFMCLPIVYTFANAFKPLEELWEFPPKIRVRNPTLQNFQDLLFIMQNSLTPFSKHLFNTLFITVVGTAAHILVSSMCAYALSKFRFRGQSLIFTIIVFSLMFNASVTAIPSFIIQSGLGLVDTIWALILPSVGSSLGLFLMKQFIDQIPDTLLEAAEIDGAGELRKFWKVVLPNVKSAWLTLLVFCMQGLWSITSTNVVYRDEIKPLGVAFMQAMASGAISRAGVSAAVSVVMILPLVIVFLFVQSRIIETMVTSGIKE